jgi:hypothetical protein
MTRFTLQGRRIGQAALITLTWEDRTLSGDADAAAMVRDLAEAYEGQWLLFPAGQYSIRRHLENPWAARELMCMVFAGGRPKQIEGALPLLPDPPEGAIR